MHNENSASRAIPDDRTTKRAFENERVFDFQFLTAVLCAADERYHSESAFFDTKTVQVSGLISPGAIYEHERNVVHFQHWDAY